MPSSIKKELILINPKSGNFIIRNSLAFVLKASVPNSLLTLAALTPKNYKVRFFNYKTFWFKKDFPPGALVGITCYSMNAHAAYRIAERYRKAGAYVIMGGPHVTCLADEALKHCHSVVIGEAESVWPRVIKDFEEGRLKDRYIGEPLEDFFTPVFDYFLHLSPFRLWSTGIQTTRGCKYRCEFCVIPGKKLRTVKQEQVIGLINRMRSLKWLPVYFVDDNIYAIPGYAKELFKKIISLKIKWFSFSSLDIAFDEEALCLAKKSGCHNLTIGFETIEPSRLTKTSLFEKIKSTGDYLQAIKRIRSNGIRIRGAFILGFDYYRHIDYLKLLIFFLKARFYFIVLGILTPLPGSALYQRMKSENRIFCNNWSKFDCLHVVFKPKNMPAFMLQTWFLFIRFTSFIITSVNMQFFLALVISLIVSLWWRLSLNSVPSILH